jgi:hypothetical protein
MGRCQSTDVSEHITSIYKADQWTKQENYSLSLKMEAAHYSETSIDFQRTMKRYSSEGRNRHENRCEYLKSYNLNIGHET